MNTPGLAQLQQFISANKIGRTNGILLFEASIHFLNNNVTNTINSAVQVILLPDTAVLYIMEFVKQEYGQNEMYSIADYDFTCIDERTLQVVNDAASTKISISLRNGL